MNNLSFAPSLTINNSSKSEHNLTSKTYWPVPYIESIFLPHFPLVAQSTHDRRYRIETLIARGAFGAVYRVYRREDDAIDAADDTQRYALKVLNKSQIIESGSLGQVRNEVDIQRVCGHHPFIVACILFWQTHRKICIRMFVPPQNLKIN